MKEIGEKRIKKKYINQKKNEIIDNVMTLKKRIIVLTQR